MEANKTKLLRWSVWFCIGNVFLYWIIGIHYFSSIASVKSPYLLGLNNVLLYIYAALTYIGQLGLIGLLPCVFLIPLVWVFPRKNFIFFPAILLATVMTTILAADTVVYELCHFHMNGIILNFLVKGIGGEILGISKTEYILIFSAMTVFFLLELFYAFWLWRSLLNKNFFQYSAKWVIIFIALCLSSSYGMLIYSANSIVHRFFVDVGKVMPLYSEVFGAVLPKRNHTSQLDRLAETYFDKSKITRADGSLNYPSHELQFEPIKHPKNLVMIVIDAWRFDMLNSENTPALSEFAKTSWVFQNHFSGGNSTGPGIFSLFYGLPLPYWAKLEKQHRGPVLIDELLKQHYKMGIFSSAGLAMPEFDRTVFSALSHINSAMQPGSDPYQRDKIVTQKFKKFIAENANQEKPFFSFIFYDAAHSYCTVKGNLGPLQPAITECSRTGLTKNTDNTPYFNRYKNSLLLIDQQIKQVLETLKEHHLMDNTVVLITGDHGEEFNDLGLGFWGHASNFMRYQVQTPLVVHWPGKKPQVFNYQTTHYDIAPTLMKDLLGCQSPASDFALGTSLVNKALRQYLIVGSYAAFGIVEKSQVTSISPTGNYNIDQPDGQPLPSATLNLAVMSHVSEDLQKFQ